MFEVDWFTSSHWMMLGLLLGFAIVHSGLAALRPWGETKIGARLYRIIFALLSIPLATILIVYFFNHRYDGLQLWQVQGIAGIRSLVWILSAISFIFLYPATFNLLEVAAVQKPQVRLYETGIIRISRHPQMVGQVIWCLAHTLWIGTTFTLVTSFGLIAHHLFAVWHGDRRLLARYGTAFSRSSTKNLDRTFSRRYRWSPNSQNSRILASCLFWSRFICSSFLVGTSLANASNI